ncbi:MAG: low specificity L-threonine aldolase [Alphaproteobacteria bacterium]|nr:low specificity L-threonine aldolase [Alphaproteobacteria bacterium]HCP01410.1 low specificity L-threonine aldolase [Rhodospirillaceae bacterium]
MTETSTANFASDNVAGALPEVVAAVTEAASVGAMPYGSDPWTERVSVRLREVFECNLWAFPVATGTAANALALSAICPPFGTVLCHPMSHANTDECGAPEFYTGGAKLQLVGGPDGRIDPAALDQAIVTARPHGVHNMPPAAITITQESEAGTVYSADHVDAIASIAKAHGLALHMDGARFANALAALDVTAAEATWRRGIDVLSFGATKGGAMAAEAVIFFRKELAAAFGERRKRGGHLVSKMRFVSAQLDGYLADDAWLRAARAANAGAARLATELAGIKGAALVRPPEANIVFVQLPLPVLDALEVDGFGFYRVGGDGTIRLVVPWSVTDVDVDALVSAIRGHVSTTA